MPPPWKFYIVSRKEEIGKFDNIATEIDWWRLPSLWSVVLL